MDLQQDSQAQLPDWIPKPPHGGFLRSYAGWDGRSSYNIAVEDSLAGKILIAERWTNHAALTAHLESATTVAFTERW
ncbi:hypothetical protein LRF47_004886 [Salmonella enterica]|nr:hypothetical protein [Salmonella enterica]ELS1500418.1 hypothetical protein [Salmonella enterica]